MTPRPRHATGIKELAYSLASHYGWDFTYEGGMELEGEYIDDAELTRTINGQQVLVTLCYDETSNYSLTIERGGSQASSFLNASSASLEFERVGITSLAELDALARTKLSEY